MAVEKNWYVLRVVSGKEAKVKEYIDAEKKLNPQLMDRVHEVLVPMETHVTLRNGKRVEKEKVSLPGYVFVQADLNAEAASVLRFMPNCLGFLGGLTTPVPVPQKEIDRMLGHAEETEMSGKMDIPFNVNDAVKVTDGPFSGFSGVVEDVNLDKHKLKVMVKIFGRKTPLELSFMQVEKES